MSEPLAIHAWAPAAGINDALFIDVAPLRPKDAANFAINRLLARAPENRTIRFWSAFPNMSAGDQVKALIEGVPTHAHYTFYREFFQRLAAAKVVPAFMLFDHEQLLSFWNWTQGIAVNSNSNRVGVMTGALERLRTAGKLPSYLKNVAAQDFQSYDAKGVNAISQWERLCREVSYNAMRACVVDSSRRAFGTVLPMSNYGDSRPTFPFYDHNGWANVYEAAQSLAGWSSWPCYLWQTGNRYLHQPRHQQWNVMIDCLNNVRSNLARSTNVAPWISFPLFDRVQGQTFAGKRWLWRQMLLHMRATGLKRILYWNPNEATLGPAQDAYAKSVFDEMRKLPGTRQEFTAIPLNADKITSGSLTTTYAQFQAALAS